VTSRVFGITGWKNSGKTTLTEKLVGELTQRGWTVSTVKHAHHEFDIDKEGADSFRHRQAGATEVAVVSGRRWALMHELRGEAEPSLDAILARLAPCDLVLVEGYKREPHPKLEVHRAAVGKELIYPDDDWIVAVAADTKLPQARVPVVPLDDIEKIADILLVEAVALDRYLSPVT
jgi:molybdopterin-guanine dinucleotide biosynthesis protein B